MPDINTTIEEALACASKATSLYLAQNPDAWYPCGFAEVRIRPARGPLVTALKKLRLGGQRFTVVGTRFRILQGTEPNRWQQKPSVHERSLST